MAFVRRASPGLLIAWVLSACSAGTDGASPPPGFGAGGASGAAGGFGTGSVASSGGAGGDPSAGSGGTVLFGGGTTGSGGAGAASGTSGAGGTPGTDGGNPACAPPHDVPSPEVCDGLDNNLDGFIDEVGCHCSAGATQECFDGPPSQATVASCHKGTQTCVLSGEFGQWGPCQGSGCGQVVLTETCGNHVDDDCDGLVDEGCNLDAEVSLDGDCLSAFCPPQAPNPIGCEITMEGGDSRGCVSHATGSPEVYFQEGNACPFCIPGIACTGGSGRVSGKLRCSSDPTPVAFDAKNCVINKTEPSYPTPTASPITQPVSGCAQ
jgi:hypothetical protein